MIRGRFSANALYPYPYLNLRLEFPSQPNVVGYVNFIIDTGSDSTVLSLAQAADMGFDVSDVELTGELGGIGGSRATRIVDATLSAQNYTRTMPVHILDGGEGQPSLLGLDFLSRFTLVMRQRDGVAILLNDDEADALNLPANESVLLMNPSNAIARIWERDYTLWSDNPTEIVDRLGWLDAPVSMLGELDALDGFAREVRDDGVAHVVLLGMGGSSLGPETLGRCLSATGGDALPYPELIVLDSTIPARIRTVAGAIDAARTLFLVSSKSGTTIETNALYRYFRRVVEDSVGADGAGNRFVAITDAGTPLDELARRDGFRRVFRNPPDMGGRYSALSYFGLVPAALIGFDTRELLESAAAVRDACGLGVRLPENAGAALGAFIAENALAGRDKLTILTSPSLASFGLWAEQLVAESLGKNGRGVVPVVGEPVSALERPSEDRQFVSLSLAGDGSEIDGLAESLASKGYPLIRFGIDEVTDLGGEFFRWEFAIAVVGALMGVHPFNQPNVQQAKDLTDRALARFLADGVAPEVKARGSLSELLSGAKRGDYLAILAYVEQTAETDAAFAGLRAYVSAKYGIPTTLGYGPRYLHSTGQLHKGGANNVLALAVAAGHDGLPIPGSAYDFSVLADAQAAADVGALEAAGRRAAVVGLDSLALR